MKREYDTVSSFAEQRSAFLPDFIRSRDPGRRFQIELPKFLKPAIKSFRHQLDPHLLRLADSASYRRIVLALIESGIIIA